MPTRPEDYSEGQRHLVQGGFPAELLLTQEERRAAWARAAPAKNWASNNQVDGLSTRGETDVISRKTNAKKTVVNAQEPTTVPGSGNSGTTDYRQMDLGQLVAAHNLLATRAGASHATDFPSLLAGIHACQALEKKLAAPQTPAGEKETDVAKKAKAVKTKAKKVAAPKKEVPDNRTLICKDFGAREGTNRAKAIDAAFGAGAKGLKRNELLKKVYGSANVENAGALDMVWKGVPDMIAKNKLGSKYESSREGKGEETVYVLRKK